MKLINTHGMAFLGPGSEWLWTMFQFMALTITFVAVFRQLRGQQLQMHENTKLLRSEAHHNALSLLQRPWEVLIENEGLATVVTRASATPEAVSEIDWARFSAYSFMQFNGWEYCYYQSRDGSIPKELWVGADATFKSWIETKPGLARFWSESHASFDEPFHSHVAQEFARKQTPTPGLAPGAG